MSAILRNWMWILATLAVAAAVHVGSVMLVPHVIMNRTMGGIAHRAGVNRMMHTPRPTSAARSIVRPSPDLLYSTCVYDLSASGGVWVQASDMPDTYWSISVFDADTNNFYVINDRQAKAGRVQFLIVGPDWEKPMPYPLVHAPSARGLVLVRTLINDESKLAHIDSARRHATCAAYGAFTPWPPGR